MSGINISECATKISSDRLKNQDHAKRNKCFICFNILSFNASEVCLSCGEQFCSDCITQKLVVTGNKCPANDCNKIYKKANLIKSKIDELKELEVKCKYLECKEFLQIQKLKTHEESCVFGFIPCEFCSKKFQENLIKNHMKVCEEKIISCPKCSWEYKLRDKEHDCKIVSYYNKKFETSERFMQNLAKKIEEIEKTIMDKLINNKKRLKFKKTKLQHIKNKIKINQNMVQGDLYLNTNSHIITNNVDSSSICLNNQSKTEYNFPSSLSNKGEDEQERVINPIIESNSLNSNTKQLNLPIINKSTEFSVEIRKCEIIDYFSDSSFGISKLVDSDIYSISEQQQKDEKSICEFPSKDSKINLEKLKIIQRYNYNITALGSCPDDFGDFILGVDDGYLEIIKNGKCNLRIKAHDYDIYAKVTYILDLKNENKEFISAARNRRLIIWRIVSSTSIRKIKSINQGDYRSIKLERTKFPNEIISIDNDNKVRIWDIEAGTVKNILQTKMISCLENLQLKSHYDYVLAAEEDFKINLWNIYECKIIKTFNSLTNNKDCDKIVSILYYKDNFFLSCSLVEIKLWDLSSNNNSYATIYTNHQSIGLKSIFFPHNEILAIVTSELDIHFIDMNSEEKNVITTKKLNYINRRNYGKFNVLYISNNKMIYVWGLQRDIIQQFKFI
jgi:WD40 repeat protein